MNIADIESMFESYSAAWAENNSMKIASHWDDTDAEPFYKAEEINNYFHSLEDIRNYWKHNESFHDKVCLKFSNISIKPLPGNYAVAFVQMRWDIKFAENTQTMDGAAFGYAGKSMGGENHVLTLVRETESGIKLAGWSETPDSPISYMANLYEWSANPEVLS